MPFNFPKNRKEVSERIKTDVKRELNTSNPFLKNSFLSAMIVGLAGRVFDFFIQLEVLTKQMFPHTATGEWLERWGSYRDISRDPATGSTGQVIAIGTESSAIAAGLILSSSDGLEYETVGSTSIAEDIRTVTLVRVGTTVTGTTATAHNLGSNVTVTITGADQAEYNGSFEVTVTGLDTFTYTVEGSPATPATGTILATTNSATVDVKSNDFGLETNQDSGVILTFNATVEGVSSDTTVLFSKVTGGTDIQSDEAYRAEVIDAYRNPTSTFNVAAIEKKMKEVSGITRVWVEEIIPAVGQVTVYFVRDEDEITIIPDSGEVTTAKTNLLEIKPANTSDDDVIVAAPTAVSTAFTFSSSGGIVPDTTTMRTAVTANLEAFFSDKVTVGTSVPQVAYESAIYNTIDPETGNTITSFSLDAPTGDITIASGELPTLGSVTYL